MGDADWELRPSSNVLPGWPNWAPRAAKLGSRYVGSQFGVEGSQENLPDKVRGVQKQMAR